MLGFLVQIFVMMPLVSATAKRVGSSTLVKLISGVLLICGFAAVRVYIDIVDKEPNLY